MPKIFEQRIQAVQNQAQDIAKKMGMSKPEKISVFLDHHLGAIPRALSTSHWHYIAVPPFFLIEGKDIPPHLRLNGLNDPKLDSPSYLDDVTNWIQDFLQLEKKPISQSDKEFILLSLKSLQNPQLAEKAKEFILGHEVAHHYHRHHETNLAQWQTYIGKGLLLSLLVSSALITAAGLIFSFTHFVIILSLALGLVATTVGSISYQVFSKVKMSKAFEKEADLSSVKATKQRDGGVYLFQTMKDHGLSQRKKTLFSRLLWDGEGNLRLLKFSHPSESERAAYLRALRV